MSCRDQIFDELPEEYFGQRLAEMVCSELASELEGNGDMDVVRFWLSAALAHAIGFMSLGDESQMDELFKKSMAHVKNKMSASANVAADYIREAKIETH